MKKIFLIVMLLNSWVGKALLAQEEGETLFKQVCIACHTVNQGKLIGPDLANIHQKRSEAWLIKFIRSSQSLIKSGDQQAVASFNEFNQMIMPDNNYSDKQIKAILQYIAQNSPKMTTTQTANAETATSTNNSETSASSNTTIHITEEEIAAGEALFSGTTRLANGGATCNSCHHIKNDRVMGGGALAKDLTDAFSRLSNAGIRAILSNPPFPSMRQAYQEAPLTEAEVINLAAFLQKADEISETQQEKYYGARLFFAGLGGMLVFMLIFGGAWTRVKRHSVNQKIYDRQIKSS